MGRHSVPDDDDVGDVGTDVLVAEVGAGGLAGLPNGGRPDRSAALLDLTDGVHAQHDVVAPPGELLIAPEEPTPDEPTRDAPGPIDEPPAEAHYEPYADDADTQQFARVAPEASPDPGSIDPGSIDAGGIDAGEDAWWAGDAAVAEHPPAYEPPPPTMDPSAMDPGGYVPHSDGAEPVPLFTPYWAADAPPPPGDPGAFVPLDPVTGAPFDHATFATPDPALLPVAEPAAARPRSNSTSADVKLIRERSDVRARVLAGLFAPFVIYVVIMALIGASGRQYLIFLFIPLVVAGILIGTFLDLAHRGASTDGQPTSNPSPPAP